MCAREVPWRVEGCSVTQLIHPFMGTAREDGERYASSETALSETALDAFWRTWGAGHLAGRL
jgi:hypothetical protein